MTGLNTGWQHFSLSLVPANGYSNGRLSVVVSQPGTVWLDLVSLFPRQTFHNRTNGLRPDLANMLVGLQPAFMRFPGGSWVNGDSLTNMYNWKRTSAGNGSLAAALGEAAFMTGLERNSDVVTMASYAPLFANLSNKNWNRT